MATVDQGGGLLSWLVRRRVVAGTALIVLGIAIAVLPTLLASWYGAEYLGTVVFSGLFALLMLGVGVTLRFLPAEASENAGRLLGLVLLLGGVGGLLVALVGVALTVHWSSLLTDWLGAGKREGAAQVLAAFGVFLAGLLLMFVTMQLGRAEEHRNPGLRRLMYGYNAVFSGVLLLLILAVVNVLAGVKLTWAVDATSTGEYSLSDRTVNMLKGLDRPLKIYVVWPPGDDSLLPIRSLLDNMESRSQQVQVEYYSSRSERLRELFAKYPRKVEDLGILLVYGEEKPDNAVFLKQGDLFESGMGDSPSRFRGEDKIDAALSGLEGGGQKTIVYVTQGEGEPSLTDTNPRTPPGGEPGLGVLRDRLTARGNFDVRELKLGGGQTKVPDDCKVLVVANPKSVNPLVVDGLRSYLTDRKGKAVFLFGVPARPTGEKIPTSGAEPLVADFNVEVISEQIQSAQAERIGAQAFLSGMDGAVFAVSQQLIQSRSNELATAFARTPFELRGVRLVRPGSGRRPDLQAQSLLVTDEGEAVWVEPKWNAVPTDMLRAIARRDAEALKRISQEPLSGAVVVAEGGKPRLAVFGATSFVTNQYAAESGEPQYFSLFASTLDWLAERSTSIGIEPRNLTVYSLDPTVRFSYLLFLPGLLACVTILGLGLGVWVVRRR
jgi:hypothetical protein